MDEPFVGVKDLAEHYGPPVTWWYAQAAAGTVPSYKLGKYVKFRLSEVEAWVQAQRQGGNVAGNVARAATLPAHRGL